MGNFEVYATLLLRSFGIKEVLAWIQYFSEGSTSISLNLQSHYDSLENHQKVHSVP